MGDYKNPTIADEDNLHNASLALKDTKIFQHSFAQLVPQKKAFYYLDPPYHKTFEKYNGNGFGEEGHKKLSEFWKGYFMVSN